MKIPFALRAAWEAQELIRTHMKADATYTFHILIEHTSNLLCIHTQCEIQHNKAPSFQQATRETVQSVFKYSSATRTDSTANRFPASRDAAAGCKLPLGRGKEEIYIGKDEDHKWKTTVSLADAKEISLCYHN